MTENNVFVKITNQMIYDKILDIDQAIRKQNGIIKWHNWAIGTLVVIIAAVITRIL